MANVSDNAAGSVGKEEIVDKGEDEAADAKVDEVEASARLIPWTETGGVSAIEGVRTYASSPASSRKSSGSDFPETKSTMTVMKAPKMRFCKAIPAPEAIAAKIAMPWRVYSKLPANVNIL